jgi:hypothetical protein
MFQQPLSQITNSYERRNFVQHKQQLKKTVNCTPTHVSPGVRKTENNLAKHQQSFSNLDFTSTRCVLRFGRMTQVSSRHTNSVIWMAQTRIRTNKHSTRTQCVSMGNILGDNLAKQKQSCSQNDHYSTRCVP